MSPTRTPSQGTGERAKQEKTAATNTREGYGNARRAAHISAKPDGDTSGGPGANNETMRQPSKPRL